MLEETFVVHIIRPYSTHKSTEIVMTPKVYGFDTGFVSYVKGRNELRAEDLGFMWEHCILNELHAHLQTRSINYWRDKRDHEIDFIIHNRTHDTLDAIECKFNSSLDDLVSGGVGKNFDAFRSLYPEGNNFVVSHNIDTPIKKKFKERIIWFVSAKDLMRFLTAPQESAFDTIS